MLESNSPNSPTSLPILFICLTVYWSSRERSHEKGLDWCLSSIDIGPYDGESSSLIGVWVKSTRCLVDFWPWGLQGFTVHRWKGSRKDWSNMGSSLKLGFRQVLNVFPARVRDKYVSPVIRDDLRGTTSDRGIK